MKRKTKRTLAVILAMLMCTSLLAACAIEVGDTGASAGEALTEVVSRTEGGDADASAGEMLTEVVPTQSFDVLPLAARHMNDWPMWEYSVLIRTGFTEGAENNDFFNRKGQDGWLLVGMTPPDSDMGLPGTMIFVRPLP